MQAEGPVVRLAHQDGYVGWLITDHSVARAMLADPRFSARPDLRRAAIGTASGAMMAEPAPGEFINMDRPEHSRYRRVLTRYFTAARLGGMREWITSTVHEHLDRMATDGAPVDLMEELATPVPALVICELLGVPEQHRAAVVRASTAVAVADGGQGPRLAGVRALTAYLEKLVRHRRTSHGRDLISVLAAEEDLTDEEVTNIALGVVLGGHETTASMIGLGVFALLAHPEQRALFDDTPIGDAVDELLRYLTITHLALPYRAALEDVELGGVRIRAGETVTVALPIANRDPRVFGDASSLRLDRPDAGRHLAFGYGNHQCLGQHLARLELEIVYPALFERFPRLQLAADVAEIPMRATTFIYGPHRLPVTWE